MATVASVISGTALLYYNTTAGTVVGGVVTLFGYTIDGATVTYTPTINDVEVEEETFAIDRLLQKEEFEITFNMAESSLTYLQWGQAGALTGGAGIVNLGGGAMVDVALKLVGVPPGGTTRTIYIPYANPTGTVGMSYKKGEATVIPLTFKAYQGVAAGTVVSVTDV